MLSDSEREALEDIRENLALALFFVRGLTLNAFCGDPKSVYAAARCYEIIREAESRLPGSFEVPEIFPYTMRRPTLFAWHGFIMFQWGEELWEVIQGGLPGYLAAVESFLTAHPAPTNDNEYASTGS